MDNATPGATSAAYSTTDVFAAADGTKVGPRRNRTEARRRAEALRALIPEGQTVVYAIRLGDGTVKIGCTANLQLRRNHYADGEIVAFCFGSYEEEQAIHASLREHVARGREYYHMTPEVIAVVNDMRDRFGLPHIAA